MEKGRFTNLIDSLSEKALSEKWIPTYDRELDYFSWTKENLSDDSKLIKVAHETFLFLDRGGNIEGLAVEYLKNNFVAHNNVFRDLPGLFTVKIDESTFTLDEKKGTNRSQLLGLAESLKADIYKEIIDNDNKDEIEGLISAAMNSKS
ncbi:MAG: hypothetical protein Q8R55_02465 [Candidatus Taylorbacteria bacterium]|nr:hypothetical protein [Candidatus Taylorbacteria bacterium]